MDIKAAKQKFIDTWGMLGSEWGINRSVAQVQALLLVSAEPLSTDDIMETLSMSRGNVNMSLRQLLDFGIIYKKVIAGDRKEYFVAEKDVWKWSMKVAAMRKQKEIDPVIAVLDELKTDTKKMQTAEAKEFHKTIKELHDFTDMLAGLSEKIMHSNRGELLIKILKTVM